MYLICVYSSTLLISRATKFDCIVDDKDTRNVNVMRARLHSSFAKKHSLLNFFVSNTLFSLSKVVSKVCSLTNSRSFFRDNRNYIKSYKG